MGRVKVVMEPINNHKKRNLTFHGRKEGIFKKARELATLCDVNVSMIIYDHPHETPHIFPPDPDKFHSSIHLYKKYRTTDRGKIKSCDLSGFFKDRKVKIEEELEKAKKKNLETKYPCWFDFLNDFSEQHLREFASGLGNKIDNVKTRIESLKKTSKIQNLGHYPLPADNILDMTASTTGCNEFGLFPCVEFIGDDNQYQSNTMNMQYSSNPNLVDTDMMINMLMSDDDNACPMMPMNEDIIDFDFDELLNPSCSTLMSEDYNCNYCNDEDNFNLDLESRVLFI